MGNFSRSFTKGKTEVCSFWNFFLRGLLLLLLPPMSLSLSVPLLLFGSLFT